MYTPQHSALEGVKPLLSANGTNNLLLGTEGALDVQQYRYDKTLGFQTLV